MNKCDRYCEVSGTPMMIGSHSVNQEAIYASLRRPATDQSEHVIMSPCGSDTGPVTGHLFHPAAWASRFPSITVYWTLGVTHYQRLIMGRYHTVYLYQYMRHKNTEIASHKCRLLYKKEKDQLECPQMILLQIWHLAPKFLQIDIF